MGKPVYLKVEKVLNQPLGKVWEAVALEFGKVSEYNPGIRDSRLDSELSSGVGMKRHCEFSSGGYIKEEIIDWQDQQSFELKFIDSSMPMSHLKSKFLFKEENGATKLTQEFWFRMGSPMGWMSFMMKGKMKKMLQGGLDGLDEHLNK